MTSLIDVPCGHCGAKAGKPCLSVGGKQIVTLPHMARMKASDYYALNSAAQSAATRDYERAAIVAVFGVPFDHIPDRIVQRAKRERSIDLEKRWVKDALLDARDVSSKGLL